MISQKYCATDWRVMRSVRLGLVVAAAGLLGGKTDEIEDNPAGEETHRRQVKEYIAIDETVHNAEHEAPLPGFQRPRSSRSNETKTKREINSFYFTCIIGSKSDT